MTQRIRGVETLTVWTMPTAVTADCSDPLLRVLPLPYPWAYGAGGLASLPYVSVRSRSGCHSVGSSCGGWGRGGAVRFGKTQSLGTPPLSDLSDCLSIGLEGQISLRWPLFVRDDAFSVLYVTHCLQLLDECLLPAWKKTPQNGVIRGG